MYETRHTKGGGQLINSAATYSLLIRSADPEEATPPRRCQPRTAPPAPSLGADWRDTYNTVLAIYRRS